MSGARPSSSGRNTLSITVYYTIILIVQLTLFTVSNVIQLDYQSKKLNNSKSFFVFFVFFLFFLGNIQQGDENLQLGATLDDLKIEMEDGDEEQGIQGIDGTVRKKESHHMHLGCSDCLLSVIIIIIILPFYLLFIYLFFLFPFSFFIFFIEVLSPKPIQQKQEQKHRS